MVAMHEFEIPAVFFFAVIAPLSLIGLAVVSVTLALLRDYYLR